MALEYLNKGGSSDVFNLGNGHGFSVREIIDCARQVTKQKIPLEEANRRPGDPSILVGGSNKAYEVLEWIPKHHKLEQIISTAWKWHQKILLS